MPNHAASSAVLESPRVSRETFRVFVNATRQEAAGIRTFELVDPDGSELPRFAAGAHIDVHLREGMVRQYSLCNAPSERNRYVIAVLAEAAGRGGSLAVHELRAGDSVMISGPRNRFPLAGPEANFHLLLAGGIGVTPMMAMIAELEARGAPYVLHYCTKTPENTAFLSELRPRIEAGRVFLHHDAGDPSRGLDIAATVASYAPGKHLYFCGPAGFMAAVRSGVGAWPPHTVHFEYFTAADDDGVVRENTPFQVTIRRTGQVFDISASESIVDVLRASGFNIETDCREGYCGTCITRYVGGEPEHRDTVLSEAERQKYVMICCARAIRSPLVLDL